MKISIANKSTNATILKDTSCVFLTVNVSKYTTMRHYKVIRVPTDTYSGLSASAKMKWTNMRDK